MKSYKKEYEWWKAACLANMEIIRELRKELDDYKYGKK